MKSRIVQMLCRVLVVSLMMLPFHAVQAGMIGSGQVAATADAAAERAALLGVVERSDVAGQLQSLGIDPATAKQRVAAMTDQEVHTLSGNIASLPAGAHSSNGWVWAVVIIVAVVIYYNWK